MIGPDELTYDSLGLVPCIVQDAATGEVLMLAWQSREALEQTLSSGKTTFWSRSREEYWRNRRNEVDSPASTPSAC